jgi:hypothetical protein
MDWKVKMDTLQIQITDAQTGEIVEREMTEAELEAYQIEQAADTARAEQVAKAETDKATAQAKLEALGLTIDDLAALGL